MRPSSGGLRRLRQVPPEEQWNGYLKNIGAYSGRRAVCDSRGTVIADFQAEVVANLFRSGDNACDEFLLWKATVQTADGSESSEEEWSRDELAEMGAVAADGSFSLGPTVFCGEEFVIEQCVHEGPSRIRTILAFDWEGRLCGLTACREKRAARRNEQSSDHESQAHSSDDKSQQTEIEPAAWRSPNILLDYLLGTWTGRGIIVDRATRSARLVRSEHRWKQTDGLKVRQISGLQVQGSSLFARVESTARQDGNVLIFGQQRSQVVLLPGGISVACPFRLRDGMSFVVETCFLMRPDYRKRIVRTYNNDCEWLNTVFLTEKRIG